MDEASSSSQKARLPQTGGDPPRIGALARVGPALALGCFALAFAVIARDAAQLGLAGGGFVAGAICTLAVVMLGSDCIGCWFVHRVSRAMALSVIASAAVLAPIAFAIYGYATDAGTLSWKTPLFAGSVALALSLLMLRLRRDAARIGLDALGVGASAALAFTALLLWTHVETATLLIVRPGTEGLHLGLYCASWASVVPFVAVSALGYSQVSRQHGVRRAAALSGLTFGIACLEVDRYWLVGLYESVHVWLGIVGVACSTRGIADLLSGLVSSRARVRRAVAIALPLAGLSAATFAVSASNAKLAVRGALAATPLGSSLLELLPEPSRSSARLPRHPALDYRQYLAGDALEQKPNILLVTVDALRADALAEMPNAMSIAEQGVLFTRAYAQGSRTAIGMGTLMTGRYSANLDWKLWVYRGGALAKPASGRKRDEPPGRFVFTSLPDVDKGSMLAERLRKAGYFTCAVPFAYTDEFFRKDLVFARGFDRFVDLSKKRWKAPSAERVIELSLGELARVEKRPWFHWVHLYDPHEAGRRRERYDRLVQATDEALLKLVQELERRGEWERTVFVLLADHGQALGEHRQYGHATSLYEEQIQVPFLLRVPGIEPQRIDEPVAAIDATATLAVLAGASTRALDGVNLMPRLKGERPTEPRPIFSELHRYLSNRGVRTTDLKAVVFGDFKLVLNRKHMTWELFDLNEDPSEHDNLALEVPEKRDELQSILLSFLSNSVADDRLP